MRCFYSNEDVHGGRLSGIRPKHHKQHKSFDTFFLDKRNILLPKLTLFEWRRTCDCNLTCLFPLLFYFCPQRAQTLLLNKLYVTLLSLENVLYVYRISILFIAIFALTSLKGKCWYCHVLKLGTMPFVKQNKVKTFKKLNSNNFLKCRPGLSEARGCRRHFQIQILQ